MLAEAVDKLYDGAGLPEGGVYPTLYGIPAVGGSKTDLGNRHDVTSCYLAVRRRQMPVANCTKIPRGLLKIQYNIFELRFP
jgi:hypothetical protein